MDGPERREHRRLGIRLPLEFALRGREEGLVYRTITRNVSTGGIYFEIEGDRLKKGDKLDVELTVPPGTHFPYQGRVSTVAQVVRVVPIPPAKNRPNRDGQFGVGAKLESWVLSF